MANSRAPIAVIGAGSWGTALAMQLARVGHPTYIWGANLADLKIMKDKHCNQKYLPDITLPDNLSICLELQELLSIPGLRDILIVVPSHAFAEVIDKIKPLLPNNARICWGTKGIDPATLLMPHQIIADKLGKDFPAATISGPSFAKEVALDMPTAVVIASKNAEFGTHMVTCFNSGKFRVYRTDDMIGVQIGGAVKNVLAVAVGMSDGLGCGANARSALITRGLAEMIRLGTALGGLPQTFMGLTGMGDLVLTCTDNLSRNRRFGLAVGQGQSMKEAEQSIGQVVEGVSTTRQIMQLARQHHIEMPITEIVFEVLEGNITPDQAGAKLLSRPPTTEFV